ncbi:MAG: PmoA family protein [Verrucomicrobia bacterium]|nr:PmoA family protein [Verrucomicrobiota bacterium]
MSDPVDFARSRTVPVSLDRGNAPGFPTPFEQTSRFIRLTEAGGDATIPLQYEADSSASGNGRIWWLQPPSTTRERRFTLETNAAPAAAALSFVHSPHKDFYDLKEGPQTVFRYNHGTVPVPPGIGTNFARGDYIMPLFGLNGELVTDDYPKDHPHHRGLGWSWPVTRWGLEVRDIWAVSGVWARPQQIRRLETGPVFALLEADSVWKWGDTQPIVHERVLLRAFRRAGDSRFIDVEVQLRALADGVAIGGRPHGGYGGFGVRAQPADRRAITLHTDPPEASPRRSWLDYSGVFKGANTPSGLAIFEHTGNLFYPNQLLQYPELNYVMPAFPGEREVPLSREKPLVLKHRLWIHTGMADAKSLAEVWSSYAKPPRAAFAK